MGQVRTYLVRETANMPSVTLGELQNQLIGASLKSTEKHGAAICYRDAILWIVYLIRTSIEVTLGENLFEAESTYINAQKPCKSLHNFPK